ncbi:PspC domain-containing protein [Fodinibius sp.]|uniref:PspC domain-containing protein n=1 Tax=Fodinibius sp. TaxID=1872440 RepID=UPI002ACE9FEB|nr:PspC domain-containing protein [Fodinibius sp.]MDZ7659225.1 PspC domain-containing protein [Fodinibius sp.]
MADYMKQRTKQQHSDSLLDFEAHELQATMHEFLEDEKKSNTNIWNFSTIAGIAMFFVGIIFIIQTLGLSIGPDVSGLIEMLPLIGGVIVTMVGFGYFVGDKKKSKKNQSSKSYDFDYDFGQSESQDTEEDFTLNNDLGSKSKSKNKKKSSSSDSKSQFDSYAFKQTKKLYKSRTNKKIAGVCGGLGKYFGISAGVIRALFIITLFAGGGTSLLIYIALAIALDKEPPEMMDDFEF